MCIRDSLCLEVGCARVDRVVGDTCVERLLATQLRELGDDNRQAVRLRYSSGEDTDRASATNKGDVAFLRLRRNECVVGDGQRLDERSLVERNIVGNRVNPATLHSDLLGEAAATTCEADEVHVRVEVVRARLLRVDVVRQDVRLDDNVLADLEVVDTLAERRNNAGELVAEGDRRLLTSDRVRMARLRAEDRAFEVLVQVGAANAAPGNICLLYTSPSPRDRG